MKKTTLSIIIPTIGRETLWKVLEGIILSDNFFSIRPEICIVYDGHCPILTPEQRKLLQTLHARVFETEKKIYSGGARNLGIDRASGDILAFLGDDTIPCSDWLQRVYSFHETHPAKNSVFLGKVSWTQELAKNPFHQWLEDNAQFDYKYLIAGGKPSWKHFYTSNISLKKDFIGNDRFSDAFVGWGFEDSEFGYRLEKRRMKLYFDPTCEVLHDHRQSPQNVFAQTRNARKNAFVFESLHPEISLIPKGMKQIFLIGGVLITWPFQFISPQVLWWRQWKKAWIGW